MTKNERMKKWQTPASSPDTPRVNILNLVYELLPLHKKSSSSIPDKISKHQITTKKHKTEKTTLFLHISFIFNMGA